MLRVPVRRRRAFAVDADAAAKVLSATPAPVLDAAADRARPTLRHVDAPRTIEEALQAALVDGLGLKPRRSRSGRCGWP